jgi:hypothetical protein
MCRGCSVSPGNGQTWRPQRILLRVKIGKSNAKRLDGYRISSAPASEKGRKLVQGPTLLSPSESGPTRGERMIDGQQMDALR